MCEAVEARPFCDGVALLRDLDAQLRGVGQTTAVVAAVGGSDLRGASVGDSGAWLIGAGEVVELTSSQQRKPLIGAGCTPVAFAADLARGATLLVASDGLLRYAKMSDIARVAQLASLEQAVASLIDLVRLPTGRLQDDVSIVLCRRSA